MLGVHESSCRSVELVCRHRCHRDRASSWEIIRKQNKNTHVRCTPSCRSVELVCRHRCHRDRASSWEIIRKQEQEHMLGVH